MNVLRYFIPIINCESVAELRSRALAKLATYHPRNVMLGLHPSEFRSAGVESKSTHGAVPLASGPLAPAPTPSVVRGHVPPVLLDALVDAIAPAHCTSLTKAKGQLLQHLSAGRWGEAARMLRTDSPQYVVLHALSEIDIAAARASQPEYDRKEIRSREVLQFAVAPTFKPALDKSRSEAEQVILSPIDDTNADGSRLAIALGSTYLWAPGQPLYGQDAVYTSRHATVVTDGLGGHANHDNLTVRQAREATGTLMAHVVESARQTQPQPSRFLYDKAYALMSLVDKTVNWTLNSSKDIQERIDKGLLPDDFQARAAALVVADCPDGLVAFGAGDCELLLGVKDDKSGPGITARRFVPQEDAADPSQVGGFGQGELAPAQCGAVRFEPGQVRLFALGTDGVFGTRWRDGTAAAFAKAVAAEGSDEGSVRDAMVESLKAQVLPAREATLDAIAKKKNAGEHMAGLDDVALVVRRPLNQGKPS